MLAVALAIARPADGPAGAGEAAGVLDAPRTDTPLIENGSVRDSALVGDDLVVVVGTFTGINNAVPGDVFYMPQDHVAAYRPSTGEVVTTFDPQVDGVVLSVEPSADGTAVFIGGRFTSVDGVPRGRVAKLDLAGDLDLDFEADVSAAVEAMVVGNGRVYVGGNFRSVDGTSREGLAALDAATGDLDPTFDLPVTGPAGNGDDNRTVRALDLTPDGDTLLSVHQALFVDGQDRAGVALIDLRGDEARVAPWSTGVYRDTRERCDRGFIGVLDGAFAPDGTWFVTIGRGDDVPPACDTAVRFETRPDAAAEQPPTWVTRLHDSSYSVAISPSTVFVGGHFYSVEAPGYGDAEPWWPGEDDVRYGCDTGACAYETLGPEVIRREQIAALDPADGKALPWNPGSSARQAVFSLEWTPLGLLVGQDNNRLGGVTTGRHGLFPVVGGDDDEPRDPGGGEPGEPGIRAPQRPSRGAPDGVARPLRRGWGG